MPEKEYKPTEELEAKEGYVKDPVSGKLVKITPERVEAKIVFAQRLLNEYGYSKEQIQINLYYSEDFDALKNTIFPSEVGAADVDEKEKELLLLFPKIPSS